MLNVVSVAAAWGALILIWQKGYGSSALWGVPATGSIPNWIPVIVFAFLATPSAGLRVDEDDVRELLAVELTEFR